MLYGNANLAGSYRLPHLVLESRSGLLIATQQPDSLGQAAQVARGKAQPAAGGPIGRPQVAEGDRVKPGHPLSRG
jgi:hypothetical protein